MAAALRSALHPLAAKIDDGVLEDIADQLRTLRSDDDLVETLQIFIPGYDDLSKAQQRTKAKAAKVAIGGEAVGPDSGTPSVSELVSQMTAATLSSGSTGGPSAGGDGGRAKAATPKAEPISAALQSAVIQLRALLPHLSPEEAVFALNKCERRVDVAADYCLEHDVGTELEEDQQKEEERSRAEAQRVEEEARAEEEARRRVLGRYDERVDDKDKSYNPLLPKSLTEKKKKGEKVLAFVDGQPVFVRPGEKYVVEKAPEPAPGTTVGPAASNAPIKVKKKGQGGASPGFK